MTAVDWIVAGTVFVASVLLSRLIKHLVERMLRRMGATGAGADALARLSGYIVILTGLFYSLSALNVRVGPLLGALGLGGLLLALSVQGPLENVVAGFLLQSRREFKRGDLIQTDSLTGVVEDINARTVVLRALSGEQHVIPNATVMNNRFTVYTDRPVRRSMLVVGVEYATDLREARQVLIQAMAGAEGVVPEPLPDAEVARFAESSIEFEARFWHGSADSERFRTTGRVAIAIKEAFNERGITIAFPQRVLWAGEPFEVTLGEQR